LSVNHSERVTYMGGECYSISSIQNFVSRDRDRILGEIIKASAKMVPYIDVLPAGTIDNQIGYNFRAVIQENSVIAAGLTIPTFIDQQDICRNLGGVDKAGTREYYYTIGELRGRSEEICVTQAKTAFKMSYTRLADSLTIGISKLKNADIRGQMFIMSGLKLTIIEGASLSATLQGTIGAINTEFISTLPDSYVTFKNLKRLANSMADDFMATPFNQENGQGEMFKWIGSRESIDRFRDELDVRADIRSMVTGRYQMGEQAINGFTWDGPYERISFGVDPQPLRAAVGGGGPAVPGTNLELVEPEISVEVTNGVGARPNPAWLAAPFEIGSFWADKSFRRDTGKSWLGEGDMSFPHQLALDSLVFKSIQDNDCNWFGDMGRFGYRLSRAYEPMNTANVCFVLYYRCPWDMNNTSCSGSDSSLDSL